MSYIPHPDTDPLLRRPERESAEPPLDDEAARNRTSALEPSGQGSNLPGLLDAPPPGLTAENAAHSAGRSGDAAVEEQSANIRQTLHDNEIESTGPLSDEARRQLEQNIVPQENYP